METQGKREGKKPDFIVKVVAGPEGRERWTNIGVAFQHSDNIQVLSDVLPQGKLVLTKYVERPQDEVPVKQRRFQ